MLRPFGAPVRHLGRYREIAHILIRHGFDNITEQLGLRQLLSLPARLVGTARPAEQLSTAEHLRLAAEELGPTFIKLGQLLSTRPDLLPPEFLRELSKLRDRVPPFPFDQAREIVETELGATLEELFASFDLEPLAAASLGQVHAATLPDGSKVVVKVQRPGIREQVAVDLDILYDLARLGEQTVLGEGYPLLELADEFAMTLRAELDYVREGQHAERFRANFAARREVCIPRVYWEFTTSRVLTLQRLRGMRIDDVEGIQAAGLDPRQVALNSVDLIMQETFVDGFFHADPHPGNFYVLEGNVIGAMDFGMVGFLDRRTKERLMRLFIAFVSRDPDQVVAELVQMEMVGADVDHRRLSRDVHRLLERYWGLRLQDLTFKMIFDDLMPIAFRHRLSLPTNLWMLGKVLVMMEGTGRLLYPEMDIFALAIPYAKDALREISSPSAWLRRVSQGVQAWGDFWISAPQRLPRLLDQLGKGQLSLSLDYARLDDILHRLDRMVNRLVIALLLASVIIGIGLVLSAVSEPTQELGGLALMVVGLLLALSLGCWLLWSVWRSGRR